MLFNSLGWFERLYIVTAAMCSVGSLFLGFFVYFRARSRLVNCSYFWMSLSVAAWSAALFICHTSSNMDNAFFWNKIVHVCSIFIPISFFHFILQLLNFKGAHLKAFYVGILMALILILFVPGNLILAGVSSRFDFHVWPTPGLFYPFFLFYYFFFASYGLWLIGQECLRSTGNRHEQLKFIFLGLSIAFTGGSTNYAYVYNIPVPPLGNCFVFFYVIFLAYSIIKYRLMEISVVFTRLGVFIAVYSLVLGIPFAIGYYWQGSWLLPVFSMAVLATAGPSLYLYLQRKAEERLLKDQRHYQTTLIRASSGMGRIKELDRLLKLIVRVVTRAVRVEHSMVYIFDKELGMYVLGASLSRNRSIQFPNLLAPDAPLVLQLTRMKRPIIMEETRQQVEEDGSLNAEILLTDLKNLRADLVVPSMTEHTLVGFLVLGPRFSGRNFSQGDLSVFTILANQSALAIENALFYKEMKRTQEQLFKAEKMATIGTMADGLSHQVNNRFHTMGFVAGDLQDTLLMRKEQFSGETLAEVHKELLYGLDRIQENVRQGGEIVRGLLKYSRDSDEGHTACDVDKVFDAAFEMTQFKIKKGEMVIIKQYDPQLIPKVKGNFTQLQEVFFNLIDNAYDSMTQRMQEMSEADYKPCLHVDVSTEEAFVLVTVKDNGLGVKDSDKNNLFTPFFTTKFSSKKGTGLGLYVIRKVVEENHFGLVTFVSEYKNGTSVCVRLPLSLCAE